MALQPKRSSRRAPSAAAARTPQSLLDRRRNERLNFLDILKSPNTQEDSEYDGYFFALIALSVNDYGVSRRDLAQTLNVSEGAISRWVAGKSAPPGYARAQIVEAIAMLLEGSLAPLLEAP